MVEGTSSAYFGILESVLTGEPYPFAPLLLPVPSPPQAHAVHDRSLRPQEAGLLRVVDVMQTADMHYADIVIPVASMYETDHPFEFFDNWLMARRKVIEPLGDYKSDYEFWIQLGVKWATKAIFGTVASPIA